MEKLPAVRPDICFNLCEGHWGESRESHVPAILEMLRVPYTGAGVFGLAVTLDKPTTQRLLAYHGVAVPAFQIFRNAGDPLDPRLGYPLFVKPSREGSSIGISASSIVRDEPELRRQLAAQLESYQQPILVERYIRGREVTVGVRGQPGRWPPGPAAPGGRSQELPGRRVRNLHCPIKADPGDEYFYSCPAPLSAELDREVRALAVTVFRETGCRDVARIDFRLDEGDGDRPYVIEVNALPGIAPGWSDLSLAAEAAGMTHAELINKILQAACRRYGLDERKR